jgi:2-dehydropantoate 2-reductase
MRIAVMGAGAIGGYVGARLAAAGEDVVFIARGSHLSAMQSAGLAVDSPLGNVNLPHVAATGDPSEIGPVDLVLFTVKLWDTEQAAGSLAPLIGKDTRLVTLQNGIDSIDILSQFVAKDQIVGGVIYVAASIARPGVIRHSGGTRRVIVDAARGDAIVVALSEASRRAIGIDLETTNAIGRAIWEKFIRFAAFSAATALLRTSAGPLFSHPETRVFFHQLLDDGVSIAEATGNGVTDGLADAAMALYSSMPPTTRSSMSSDLERGKPLEVPWISGRIHELGLQYGVPTPAHTAAYRGLVLYANGTLEAT